MSDNKQTDNSPVISENRRKLLKASAATPLIATLTFGAEQANASAYQCMDKETPTVGYKVGADSDQDVRVAASKYIKKNFVDLYEIIGPPSLIYDLHGNPVSVMPGGYKKESTGHALVMYEQTTPGTGSDGVEIPVPSDVWPHYQIGSITHQPLFVTCLNSLVDTNINGINGNIV